MHGITAVLPNELALVARARVEPAAFAAVYDHYFPRVYNYVRYRVSDAATADDLTAQVFERVLTKIKHYDPKRGPFAAWLFAIARNTVNDHLRARRRHRWLSLEALRDWSSDEPQPEDLVVRNESHAEMLAAVACLNNRQRNLIALKFGAGLSNRRIAELTGLSESNVGVILYRSVRQLRVALSAEESDHE